MTLTETREARPQHALASLLENYTVEITAHERKSFAILAERLPTGSEVFIASIPGDKPKAVVETAAHLRHDGYTPVPHIVARNIPGEAQLDDMLARLAGEAGVERALVLGGDRDDPAGELDSSLQVIRTGFFQNHGIGNISIAAYPEGHPRIADDVLETAMKDKLAAAADAGLNVRLVSQFGFEPAPIVDLAQRLRAAGITAPLHVGVAGPASRTKLAKYALRCGVGTSLRALRERQGLARSMTAGETPERLLAEVAAAHAADPSLGIDGVHFFTFGDPASSIDWAEEQLRKSQ